MSSSLVKKNSRKKECLLKGEQQDFIQPAQEELEIIELEEEDYESETEDEDSGISDTESIEPEEVAMYNTHLVDYLHTIPGFADFLREFFEDHFEEFQAIYENANFTHDQKVHYFGVWMEHICRQRREFRRRHRERYWERVTREANQQAE